MSTAVLGMQSMGVHSRNLQLDFDMTSKTPNLYGTSSSWAPSSQREDVAMASPLRDYTGFPAASTRPSDGQFTFDSGFEQVNANNHDFRNDFKQQLGINAPLGVPTTDVYSSPASFTASSGPTNQYDSATISPLDTHFKVDHASPGSDAKFQFDSYMRHAVPSGLSYYDDAVHPSKRRCDSLQSAIESQSPPMSQAQVGRRRGSEYAEPGSARAVYLEKNRKAASKCRSKQKRQQEELVETARDVERRNKILKAEVEMLKSGMRDLMELVGQHTNCPDARLKLYVQREADRLAVGNQRNALPSPLSASSYSGHGSIDKASSAEDE